MRRRNFLGATVASAGALTFVGCSDATVPSDAPSVAGPEGQDGSPYFPQSVASGDPKPDSVILWTRVEDADRSQEDITVFLEVALDEAFSEVVLLSGEPKLTLTAQADFDHCVKARVQDLLPGTYYFYRFRYETAAGETHRSRTGRTKTAPSPDADVTVRFGVASCQDYIGRYYHSYRHMAEQDLDFFVHLGDYIYETSGDPEFQGGAEERRVAFRDEAQAIPFDGGKFYAARVLSNYRDLYQTYRGDRDLQRMHERFPMIAVWDDHEFSDDCYGETATYSDGKQTEHDPGRRRAADQAWFEYMPVDYAAGPDFKFDNSASFPGNLEIYRDFEFGKHMHLVMTDLRRYRPDHIIAEDAFPGAIAATQTDIETHLGEMPALAAPYVQIGAAHAQVLKDHADLLGIDPENVKGNVSVSYINDALATIEEAGGPPSLPLDPEAPQYERGIAYFQLMKSSQYSMIGARALLVKAAYDAVTQIRYRKSNGASENVLGDRQQTWMLDTLKNSEKTWKVWGNGFTFMPKLVDLTQMGLPEQYSQIFYLSGEDWDGAPNRRNELLDAFGEIGNVVAVTGDIHAFFAGCPRTQTSAEKGMVEFVCGGISSGSYKSLLVSKASSTPSLRAIGARLLAENVKKFLMDDKLRTNPHLSHANVDEHGYGVLEVSKERITATFFSTPEGNATTPPSELEDSLDTLFTATQFVTESGAPEVYRTENGNRERWDLTRMKWV